MTDPVTDPVTDPIDDGVVDDGPTIEEVRAAGAPVFEKQPDAADLPEDVPVGDPSADD